jgi:hypothetical protein
LTPMDVEESLPAFIWPHNVFRNFGHILQHFSQEMGKNGVLNSQQTADHAQENNPSAPIYLNRRFF